MQKSLITLILIVIALSVVFVPILIEQIQEAAWYDGFYQFCRHAPEKPGVAQSPAMYYESDCKDMLRQAKDIDLYRSLVIPTPTMPGVPQG